MADDGEITRPGTPDALRTWHDVRRELRLVIERLSFICNALDALERDVRRARADAEFSLRNSQEAVRVARFTDKRVDALVSRVQAVESTTR
jgi:hypothetical protein